MHALYSVKDLDTVWGVCVTRAIGACAVAASGAHSPPSPLREACQKEEGEEDEDVPY